MTKDCRTLLKFLREIQPEEGKSLVYTEPLNGSLGCFRESNTKKEFPFPFPTPKTVSVMKDLEARGFVSFPYAGMVTVRHAGWHTKYMAWERVRGFLIRSVLVPVFVSLVTSVLSVLLLSLYGL